MPGRGFVTSAQASGLALAVLPSADSVLPVCFFPFSLLPCLLSHKTAAASHAAPGHKNGTLSDPFFMCFMDVLDTNLKPILLVIRVMIFQKFIESFKIMDCLFILHNAQCNYQVLFG